VTGNTRSWRNDRSEKAGGDCDTRILGLAVQKFGPEWRVTAMIVAVGGGFALLWLGLARELKNEPVPWLVFAVWSAVFVALLLWQAWFRVWVNETGMWWRGLLSEGELRWSEIEQAFYSTHKISVPVMHIHIPLGTYPRLKVVDARGKKVWLHYRVREADVLVEWIRQKTKERLLAKAEGDGSADFSGRGVRGHHGMRDGRHS
jgi:hypothetical protein